MEMCKRSGYLWEEALGFDIALWKIRASIALRVSLNGYCCLFAFWNVNSVFQFYPMMPHTRWGELPAYRKLPLTLDLVDPNPPDLTTTQFRAHP